MPRKYIQRTEIDILLKELHSEVQSFRKIHLGGISVEHARYLLKKVRGLKEEFLEPEAGHQ